MVGGEELEKILARAGRTREGPATAIVLEWEDGGGCGVGVWEKEGERSKRWVEDGGDLRGSSSKVELRADLLSSHRLSPLLRSSPPLYLQKL